MSDLLNFIILVNVISKKIKATIKHVLKSSQHFWLPSARDKGVVKVEKSGVKAMCPY
ncbi:hypothetical protein GCM10027422_49380 [Hymenobacter arcticus]